MPELSLEEIKRIAVTAMFSDDTMYDTLVLKGGNALSLVHGIGSRQSMDLDFSMRDDLPEDADAFRERVDRALNKTFRPNGLVVFDVKMEERPKTTSADLADFWGGYAMEFKLIGHAQFKEFQDELEQLRKRALSIGQGKKFLIDLSRFEYVDQKASTQLDGYQIWVYSQEMIVCEKLRAICQKMPEYAKVIRRERAGNARARDFFDIHEVLTQGSVVLPTGHTQETLKGMFHAKKVPLSLLGKIGEFRDFHRVDFDAVRDTVAPGKKVQDFDFYFDYVLELVAKLEPLWNE